MIRGLNVIGSTQYTSASSIVQSKNWSLIGMNFKVLGINFQGVEWNSS